MTTEDKINVSKLIVTVGMILIVGFFATTILSYNNNTNFPLNDTEIYNGTVTTIFGVKQITVQEPGLYRIQAATTNQFSDVCLAEWYAHRYATDRFGNEQWQTVYMRKVNPRFWTEQEMNAVIGCTDNFKIIDRVVEIPPGYSRSGSNPDDYRDLKIDIVGTYFSQVHITITKVPGDPWGAAP